MTLGSPPYLLVCSVCEGEYTSKADWHRHLTTDKHQLLARKECLEKWSEKKMKECCVAVFSSFPLTPGLLEEEGTDNHGVVHGGAEQVLQYFSKDHTTFVTDFVFWEDRPHLGIMQFESKSKVRTVMSSVEDPTEVLIDRGTVQIKKAEKIKELEWKAILPVSGKMALSVASCSMCKKRHLDHDDSLSLEAPTSRKAPKIEHSLTGLHLEPSSTPSTSIAPSLQSQFASISSTTKIANFQFNAMLETVAALTASLRFDYPRAEVIMFRNRFLQLKNPHSSEDQLDIYAYSTTPGPSTSTSFPIESSQVDRILKDYSKYNFLGRRKGIFWEGFYKPNSIQFRLFTDSKFLMEAQASRLAEYLFYFYPKSHSLLILTYYWTTVNSIKCGELVSLEESSSNLPDPLTLQWLVIFFLCQTYRIPTPKDIQERPHQRFVDRWSGRDIGFHADLEFAEAWKSSRTSREEHHHQDSEQFTVSVLKLLQEFLYFYSGILGKGCFVLNTRNGTKQKIKGFLGVNRSRQKVVASLKARIATDQLEMKRSTVAEEQVNLHEEANKLYERIQMSEKSGQHFIIHPFNFMWSISVSSDWSDVVKSMGVTERRLATYLDFLEVNGAEKTYQQLGSLTKVLTLSQNR